MSPPIVVVVVMMMMMMMMMIEYKAAQSRENDFFLAQYNTVAHKYSKLITHKD